MTDNEIRMKIEDAESLKLEIPTRDYIELIQLVKDLSWEVYTRDRDIEKLGAQIEELKKKIGEDAE